MSCFLNLSRILSTQVLMHPVFKPLKRSMIQTFLVWKLFSRLSLNVLFWYFLFPFLTIRIITSYEIISFFCRNYYSSAYFIFSSSQKEFTTSNVFFNFKVYTLKYFFITLEFLKRLFALIIFEFSWYLIFQFTMYYIFYP